LEDPRELKGKVMEVKRRKEEN